MAEHTLETVRLFTPRIKIIIFQEQNPSQPRAMRMCLHFKIQLALPRFMLFICKLYFLVLFLRNLTGKLDPGK